MVISQNYGKDKLNSNTVFRVIERTSGTDDVEIDVVQIHTSCSKPLYMGQIVAGDNGIITLEVVDGTLLGDSILPDNVSEKCTDNKNPKHTATITLKKAITNDNGGEITDPLTFTENFLPKIDGVDVSFGETITITTKEPHTISEAEVVGYSFVLIAGDTDCPSMLGEEFTVKKNKDITCTIYNDDNGDGSTGGDGVAFGFNGLQFTNIGPDAGGLDSCAATSNVPPCVERQGLLYVIVDTLLANPDSSIILWSLTPPTGGSSSQVNNCALAGAYPASFDNSINGFGLLCSTFVPGTWNINYAFVLTI